MLGPLVAGVAIELLAPYLPLTKGFAGMWIVCGAAVLASIPFLWRLREHASIPFLWRRESTRARTRSGAAAGDERRHAERAAFRLADPARIGFAGHLRRGHGRSRGRQLLPARPPGGDG